VNHWSLWAVGYLADGTKLMIVKVSRDEWKRGFRNITFAAVLACRPEGLFRLSRNRPEKLIGPGFIWPAEMSANDTGAQNKHSKERCLSAILPKYWGTARYSTELKTRIPGRILQSGSANMGRLLLLWTKCVDDTFGAMVARSDKQFLPGLPLPPSPLCRPVAIVTIPNSDVVVRALHSGALLKRLKNGLERIYVSEMSWIRAPSMEAPLTALAHRFPTRLVLVKAQRYQVSSMSMKIKRVRAAEYQCIGYQLQYRYEDDFGYDKYKSPKALLGMFRFRIGDLPRGHKLLWIHEQEVAFDVWPDLGVNGMQRFEELAGQRRKAQSNRAAEAMRLTLKSLPKE
jgi:hypothetical protein